MHAIVQAMFPTKPECWYYKWQCRLVKIPFISAQSSVSLKQIWPVTYKTVSTMNRWMRGQIHRWTTWILYTCYIIYWGCRWYENWSAIDESSIKWDYVIKSWEESDWSSRWMPDSLTRQEHDVTQCSRTISPTGTFLLQKTHFTPIFLAAPSTST